MVPSVSDSSTDLSSLAKQKTKYFLELRRLCTLTWV